MLIAIISREGQPIPTVIQQEIGKLSEEHTKILAEEHKKELDKAIEETRERVLKPTGNHLKDAIEVEQILESGFSGIVNSGYGVGNVQTLNQKTPWWIWINFGRALSGRTVPPGTDEHPQIQGHFEPGTKGIFTRTQPKFPIFPKKAITAHNFIERSLGTMLGKVRELLK